MQGLFTRSLSLVTVLSLLLSTTTLASNTEEEPEMAALLSMLEEETELATQNRMNADYVPGMVTLLHGSEMLARGHQTVAEALNEVAGFYVTYNNGGVVVTTVRGVGASLTGNNLKIMLNGIPVNRPVDASADWAMRLPLTQVEQIEVIRGPGAALYGEYAFSGVLNIITRDANMVALSGGNDELMQGDVALSHDVNAKLSTRLNASIRQRKDSGHQTNLDNFARGGNGYAPGNIDDQEQQGLIIAGLNYEGFALDINYARTTRGGWYGRLAAMPEDRAPRIETVFNAEVRNTWEINPDLEITLRSSLLQTDLEDAEYLPIPRGVNPPGPAPIVASDQFRQDINEDISRRNALSLHWNGWHNHRIFAELSHSKSEVTDSALFVAIDDGDAVQSSDDRNLVQEDAQRSLRSATVQDQWSLHEQLEITLGLRFDDYDDLGEAFSPRAAAVWRFDDNDLFKVQYAEAFRPPSLANVYPGPNTFPGTIYTRLRDENIATTEIAYIHRGANYHFRSTIFYSEIKDLIEFFIQPGQPPIWRNRGDLRARGIELEWRQEINRQWQWDSNLAYTKAEDKQDTDDRLFGSLAWLGNLSLTWMPTANQRHTLSAHYAGTQEGSDTIAFVPEQSFPAHSTFDYTLTLDHLAGIRNLSLTASVRNLADENFNTVPNPTQYPEGLPGEGRSAWLGLQYEFK